MTQIIFGTFSTPAFNVAIQEVLSLYASGRRLCGAHCVHLRGLLSAAVQRLDLAR